MCWQNKYKWVFSGKDGIPWISGEAYLETPLLHPQSLYGSLGRSYADVITKFSRLNGLPIFITHGALLARLARTSSAFSSHSRPQSLRSFWLAAGIESSGSNHFEITKEITEFCPSGLTQSSSMAHARNGCSQSSRFLPQARRIVGSGDENAIKAIDQKFLWVIGW